MPKNRGQQEVTLAEAIGTQIKTFRQSEDLRQDDIARAANAYGFPWARTSVASLETGSRELSATELLMLPYILATAARWTNTVVDWGLILGDHRAIALTDTVPSSSMGVRDLMQGKRANKALLEIAGGVAGAKERRHRADELDRKVAKQLDMSVEDVVELARAIYGRSLALERDDRLRARGFEGSGRSRQTASGHITRALIQELKAGAK